MGLGFGITKTSSGGGGGGTTITTVANYSALPSASSVSGKFYWCEASQGTKWLPFSVGGTYYPLGMYYSNGVTWEYTETPYQATLSEVNTGTNTDKFVSPSTFTNADKWNNYVPYTGATLDVNLGTHNISSGTNLIGVSANFTRFPNALSVVSITPIGIQHNESLYIGNISEAVSVGNTWASGVYGVGYTNSTGTGRGTGVTGEGHVSSSTDVGVAVGVRGYANDVHSGNYNIGLYGDAENGTNATYGGNVALFLANGNIVTSASAPKTWYLGGNLIFDGQGSAKTISAINGATFDFSNPFFIFVDSKTDLPTAVSGVITLVDSITYFFTTIVDLLGDRIVCGVNNVIMGASSENCYIKSTGLSSSTALITSVYSLPIRNISFTHGTVLNLQGDGITTALDWFGVNFVDCATVGSIKDYSNFVMGDSAFLNSSGLTFDGTIGTIAFGNCLFDCYIGGTAIILPSTLTISRRFRIIYSSFVVLSGETGINASASATIGNEKYILDTVNFSGGGTYLSGLDATSNKSLFANCVGITNTSTRGFIYMNNNTVQTGTNNTALWFKAAGTTSAMPTNSKFDTTITNRLTYTGAFTQSFMITVNCNVRTTVSTQNINIGIAKNGTIITQSEMTILCAAGSTPSFGATQIVVELTTNDYIELFVQNSSSANNTIVSDMNMNCVKIPV
jgi:hypothetical protein